MRGEIANGRNSGTFSSKSEADKHEEWITEKKYLQAD